MKELLNLHGIDANQFDRFVDGEPLVAHEEETLLRILVRESRFPAELLDRWSREPFDWLDASANPIAYRTRVTRVAGRVTKLERVPILPDVARRVEFDHYFRVTMHLSEPARTALICTRQVPRAWQSAPPTDEPAQALGILLKSAASPTAESQLVFAAPRVAWLPVRADPSRNISAGQAFLGRLGFDVGLLDAARAENRRGLGAVDRECFYQLLAAVRRTDRATFVAHGARTLNIAELLKDAAPHVGELFTFQGKARRAIKVRIDDVDIGTRLGLDHYFQIDLFVPLDKLQVRVGKPSHGNQVPTFENEYPVTLCVASLPPDLPEGNDLNHEIRVHAALYRLWSYPSEYMSSFQKQLVQIGPLLIGTEPQFVPPERVTTNFGLLLVGLLVVSVFSVWFATRLGNSTHKRPR